MGHISKSLLSSFSQIDWPRPATYPLIYFVLSRRMPMLASSEDSLCTTRTAWTKRLRISSKSCALRRIILKLLGSSKWQRTYVPRRNRVMQASRREIFKRLMLFIQRLWPLTLWIRQSMQRWDSWYFWKIHVMRERETEWRPNKRWMDGGIMNARFEESESCWSSFRSRTLIELRYIFLCLLRTIRTASRKERMRGAPPEENLAELVGGICKAVSSHAIRVRLFQWFGQKI